MYPIQALEARFLNTRQHLNFELPFVDKALKEIIAEWNVNHGISTTYGFQKHDTSHILGLVTGATFPPNFIGEVHANFYETALMAHVLSIPPSSPEAELLGKIGVMFSVRAIFIIDKRLKALLKKDADTATLVRKASNFIPTQTHMGAIQFFRQAIDSNPELGIDQNSPSKNLIRLEIIQRANRLFNELNSTLQSSCSPLHTMTDNQLDMLLNEYRAIRSLVLSLVNLESLNPNALNGVKDVLPKERAQQYQAAIKDWKPSLQQLESLGIPSDIARNTVKETDEGTRAQLAHNQHLYTHYGTNPTHADKMDTFEKQGK
jgi:hypothetical protein